MFFAQRAVGSKQRGLDVAQRRIDPFKRRRLGGLRAGASTDRRVLAAGLHYGRKTFQAVGENHRAALERRAGELAKRGFAERPDAPQDDLVRFAVVRRLDRRDEGRLAQGAASGRAGTLAAQLRVIHLNLALQALRRGRGNRLKLSAMAGLWLGRGSHRSRRLFSF
jgi:hypothetical protein